jgi:hypothetical protein
MPLTKLEELGANADGSASEEYCRYCFQNGAFTDPNITMEGMIEMVAGFIAQDGSMTTEQAKQMASAVIPTLKRWQAGASNA